MHIFKICLHGGGEIETQVDGLVDALNQTQAFLREQEVDHLPVADIVAHAYLDGKSVTAGVIDALILAGEFRNQ